VHRDVARGGEAGDELPPLPQHAQVLQGGRPGGGRFETVPPGVVAQPLAGRDRVAGQEDLGRLGGEGGRARGSWAARAAVARQAAGAAQAARLAQLAGPAEASSVSHRRPRLVTAASLWSVSGCAGRIRRWLAQLSRFEGTTGGVVGYTFSYGPRFGRRGA